MSIDDIWEAYKDYWLEHEPDMTEPCSGESKESVEKLEKQLGVHLPEDFKKSLQITLHRTKKCDGHDHSWFGSKTGVNLFGCKTIWDVYVDYIEVQDLMEDDEEKRYLSKKISPYEGETWPKEWVPIAERHGITFFLDLRQEIGDHYGNVLAVKLNCEDDNGNWYIPFAYVAESFTDFLIRELEEVKKTKGLYDEYFLKLMNLPDNYIDDDWGN